MSDIKFGFFDIKKLPLVIVDNYFNDEELSDIWKELDFLSIGNKFLPETEIGSATDANNKLQKKGSGLWLGEFYRNPLSSSEIVKITKKIYSHEIMNKLIENNYFFSYLEKCKDDNVLINYYENNDFYKSHRDNCTVTCLIWLYKQPKKFFGGDLIVEDSFHVECVYNRLVIFPSILRHAITEIRIDTNEKYSGRYAITHFIQ